MVKVRVQIKCSGCNGEAFLAAEEVTDSKGEKYTRYRACNDCNGSGMVSKWVELPDFLLLLDQAECHHAHVTSSGGFHLKGGEIWDDISEFCCDCGQVLR